MYKFPVVLIYLLIDSWIT